MGKNKGVPKEWIGCPKNANRLIESKFMTLKTPLSSKYNHQLPCIDHFPPEELFEKAKRNRVRSHHIIS